MLLIIALDAVGDGLRTNGIQTWHHVSEVAVILCFFAVWGLSAFRWQYALTYVLCRIWGFNLIYNLTAGNAFGYLSDNNFYDGLLIWIGGVVRQDPIHFYVIFSIMALLATISVTLKNK